ncbi:hypothetical protein H2200_003997 [Cladophialophora chaetospira]|uniref:Aspartate racemase n=1 Tax=Cladophialophora chaetospira TaxID=386627 RepID=A0AA38XF97_9EURO|nr:hypothetical protein H2200_003997 [Cladophialophora chaetospira]
MARPRMKTIGIIGGSTDLATVEYYKIINAKTRERLGGFHTGRVIINSMDLADSVQYVHNELWEQGGEMLHEMAKSLERAGADMILCVSNTWHRTAEMFMKDVSIPLLHIVDPTAEAIKKANLTKVALLGTKATMSAPFLRDRYREKFGIEIIVPTTWEQDLIDRVIFHELSFWKFMEESKEAYLRIIDNLHNKGAQGIILGCTEIPLLVSQVDRPKLPMFDTLRLHAEAAVVTATRE